MNTKRLLHTFSAVWNAALKKKKKAVANLNGAHPSGLPNVSNSVRRQSVTQMISVSPIVSGDQTEKKERKEKKSAATETA